MRADACAFAQERGRARAAAKLSARTLRAEPGDPEAPRLRHYAAKWRQKRNRSARSAAASLLLRTARAAAALFVR